jgi:hypothetical protein
MGFLKPDLPDVDPDEFLGKPLMERIHILNLDWVENGFGAPRMIHVIYIAKLFLFFALGGIVIATATSPGVPAFWHVLGWWNQPIVYQKVILWTVLLEAMNLAGAWGPLNGKFKPMTGGILFWARPGTIRERPYPWIPGTGGDRRTWFDVGLYVTLLISVAVPLVLPGVSSDSLSERLPDNTSGLVNPRPARRAHGVAGPGGAAGQDRFPGRPQRTVAAGAAVFQRVAVHRHDHRAETADSGRVGRCRHFQVHPALRLRGAADGQQHHMDAQVATAQALP